MIWLDPFQAQKTKNSFAGPDSCQKKLRIKWLDPIQPKQIFFAWPNANHQRLKKLLGLVRIQPTTKKNCSALEVRAVFRTCVGLADEMATNFDDHEMFQKFVTAGLGPK